MKQIPLYLRITLMGLLLVVAGFIYDLAFAGLPYQDPSPEQQARWEFHHSIADIWLCAGGVVFLIGFVCMPVYGLIRWFVRLIRRRDEQD